MKSLRCSFQDVHEEAVKLAGVWCANSTFCEKHLSGSLIPRQFDEDAVDRTLQVPVKSLFKLTS
jgi:hypothetical protein